MVILLGGKQFYNINIRHNIFFLDCESFLKQFDNLIQNCFVEVLGNTNFEMMVIQKQNILYEPMLNVCIKFLSWLVWR